LLQLLQQQLLLQQPQVAPQGRLGQCCAVQLNIAECTKHISVGTSLLEG
jgi:hypothetical protein